MKNDASHRAPTQAGLSRAISRREAVAMSAIGLVGLSGMALAGCGPQTPGNAAPTDVSTPSADTPGTNAGNGVNAAEPPSSTSVVGATPGTTATMPAISEIPQTTSGDATDPASLVPGVTAKGIEQARATLATMTLEQKVHQMFVVTPEALTQVDVATLASETTRAALQAHPVGGIAYFAQNLTDPEQTRTLLANTQAMALELNGVPLLLGVDEEGGTVARIARNAAFGVTNPGDMRDVGAAGDSTYARDVALTIGTYLRDLGFNLDFAPVCDVASNPDSDVMALRSFGSEPQLVADMVGAQVEGFGQAGMLCSAKHFPGIGAALGDSHEVQIVSEKSVEELAAEELIPFERAINSGVPLVMVGHLSLPNATGSEEPACLNPQVATGILRERLGFGGLAISDSLSMGAVTQYHGSGEAAVLAIQAGMDLLLMPEDFALALEGVLSAIADGTLTEERIDESVARILALKFSRL